MFFIISKILFFLSQPVFWILLTLVWALHKKSWKWLKISIFMFIFFTNKLVFNVFSHVLENRVTSHVIEKPIQIGVVLGGYLKTDVRNKDHIYVNESVSRLTTAVELWKSGRIKKILLSGGDGTILKPEVDESLVAYNLCMQMGVPDSVIIRETRSRNTYENALYSKQIIDSIAPNTQNLFITSAFHMKRSMACAHKVGLDVLPYSTDFRERNMYWYAPDTWLQLDPIHLVYWQSMVREMIGELAYKLKGYN